MSAFEPTEAELRARAGIKWHQYPPEVLPAWIAEMDFDAPAPIHTALRRLSEPGAYGYEDSALYSTLAQAFATYMRQRYRWQPDPELVLPVADLVQALFTSVNAFTDAGDRVILQTPIYPPFINATRELGRRVLEHPLIDNGTRFVLDTAGLEQLIAPDTPLLFLCNPHNPTGRVFERDELEAIASVVLEHQLVVVADEVHADLTYDGKQHIPFASLGTEVGARTVTITSASKSYNIPGLRCGVMHFGSSELRERFRARVPDRMVGRINQFGVLATTVAWRECADWLDECMRVLHRRREQFASLIASELAQVRCYPPEASFLAWLDCRALNLPQPVHQFFLERARVGLTDGADFGTPGPGHVRLNFATSPTILEELLRRMASSLIP